jgi:ribosome-binding protein aMBF1 (putative translation factor)
MRNSARSIKQRGNVGQRHPKAKLSDREVELLRHLREAEGWTYGQLAEKFEESKAYVVRLCKYRCR